MLHKFAVFLGVLILNFDPLSVNSGKTVPCERPAALSAIDTAIERGLSFLEKIQKPDGAIRDTVNPLFDVWETALAASAICDVRPDTSQPVLQRALAFLKKSENAAGLICHNQKCRKATCLETTAVYFSLLVKTGQNDLLKSRFDTLQRLQQATGEWLVGNPDVREAVNFPSVTGLMLGAFGQAGVAPRDREKALLWLGSQQQPEGHWGRVWEYYGCDAYALWAILPALTSYQTIENESVIDNCLRYIRQAQLPDGSWNDEKMVWRKKPSAELQTALMLYAISETPLWNNAQITNRAIDWLLQHQQPNGGWDGGFFPINNERYVKKEYVFATATALQVLQKYRSELREKK